MTDKSSPMDFEGPLSRRNRTVRGLALCSFHRVRRELHFGMAGRGLLGFDESVIPVARYLDHVNEISRAPLASAFEDAASNGSDIEIYHNFCRPDGRVLAVRTSLQHSGSQENDWSSGAVEVLSRAESGFENFVDVNSCLIEATSDAVVLVDADARIISFNAAAEEVFGFSNEEACGQPLDLLIPVVARSAHQRFFQEFLKDPKAGRMMGSRREVMGMRRNGEEFPAEVSIAHFDSDGYTLAAAIVRDISMRRQSEVELEEARRRAEHASEAKSRFLVQMSHEIRTPLNGMLGMAEVLHPIIVDPDQREMVETILESGETLLALLNDVLDLSKISSGKLVLEHAPFLPADLARKLQSAFRVKAEAKGLAFSVITNVGSHDRRIGDMLRIVQILFNVVSNAIKFTEAGEVTVFISAETNEPLQIEVRDTGIGMSRTVIDRMFDEFEQADASTTRKFGGTGLGLSIVKGLVDLMEGEITVETEPNLGSTFKVTLPLAQAVASLEAPVHDVSEDRFQVLRGRHALVADDIATNQLVTCAILDALGVTYEVANNGLEAVQITMAEHFDFIMLDIQMPEMDGVMALEKIHRVASEMGYKPPPAVAVTANAMPEQVSSYIKNGFAACLPKPLSLNTVGKALTLILSGSTEQCGG